MLYVYLYDGTYFTYLSATTLPPIINGLIASMRQLSAMSDPLCNRSSNKLTNNNNKYITYYALGFLPVTLFASSFIGPTVKKFMYLSSSSFFPFLLSGIGVFPGES